MDYNTTGNIIINEKTNSNNNNNLLKYLLELQKLCNINSNYSWLEPRYWITFNNDYNSSNNVNYVSNGRKGSRSIHHVTPQVNNNNSSGSGHASSSIVKESARKRREALGKGCCCGWSLAVMAIDLPRKLFKNVTKSNEVLTISFWMNLSSKDDTSDSSSIPSCSSESTSTTTVKSNSHRVKHPTQLRSISSPSSSKVSVKSIVEDEIHLISMTQGNVSLEVWLNLKRDRLKFRLLCTKYWLVLVEAEEAIEESINHASTNSSSNINSSQSKVRNSTLKSSFNLSSKSLNLLNEKWHHLTITIAFGQQGHKEGLMSISVTSNGFNRSLTNIENFNDEFNPITSTSDVLLLLGTTCLPMQISSLKLTSLKVLSDRLNEMDSIFLYLLGPNDENFTTKWNEKYNKFKLPIELPKIDIEKCYYLISNFTNEDYQLEFFDKFHSNSLIEFPILKRDFIHPTSSSSSSSTTAYSKVTSSVKCLLYSPNSSKLNVPIVSNVLILSFFTPSQRSSVLGDESDIYFKLNDSISIESLLYLTGKILESTFSSPSTQSEVLTILFKLVTSNSQYYKSFININGYSMVNEMLKGIRCNNSQGLLSVYFNHCILVTQSTMNNNNLLLRSSSALVNFFKCWRLWYTNSESISMLFDKLYSLVDETNLWSNINISSIQESNLLDEIFSMLQVSFFEKNTLPNFTFNGTHVTKLMTIICGIISTPPNLQLLEKLVNCLLLLHDSNRAYVSQSRQSFYFLIPSHLMKLEQLSKQESNSDSGLSSDGWQLIKTANDIEANETIHSLIFSGLVKCLTKILGDLPVNQLDTVLGPIIKIEYLLVWTNVENATVREVVLSTLTTCLRKSNANYFVKEFTLKGGFEILSNQLSQYKLTGETISILSNFILDTESIDLASNDEWIHSRNWSKLTSIQASAFTCIMSQILKSIDETATCHWSLLIFTRLLSCIPLSSPVLKYLIDHGIINFCANVIYQSTQLNNSNVNTNSNEVKCQDILLDHDIILKDINEILEIIAYKLISSTGNIFFEAYDSSLNLFIVLSKSTSIDTDAFREGLIYLLKGAFDAIEKYSLQLSDKSSFRGK